MTRLYTQDHVDLARRLMEIGDEMDNPRPWGLDVSLVKLEVERSKILEELGMVFAVFLLEEEA